MENDNPLGNAEYQVHIVSDKDNSDIFTQVAYSAGNISAFASR
jgi:hypothetical protein